MSSHRSRGASRAMVSVCSLAAAISAAIANAQETTAPKKDDDKIQEVIVTGSRIVTQNLEAPTPVTSLSGEELFSTGVTSVGDVLNDLPALRGTFTSANSTRFIGTAGVNFLDLRGLGTPRTLVLVNGRRHVAGTDGSLEVDTNTIPVDLLDRVDVVTGGASSIYGSDAIAGVVNFVMKQNFEGLKVNAQTGLSSRGDNANNFVAVTGGFNFAEDRGNLAASLEWAKEDAFEFADRADLRNRQIFVVSSTDPMGVSNDGIPDRTFVRDAHSYYITEYGSFIPAFQVGATQVAARNRPENGQPRAFYFMPNGQINEYNYGNRDFRPTASTSDGGSGSSLRGYGYVTPQIERTGLNVVSHFDFTEGLQAFMEAKFVQVDTYSLTSPSFNQTVSAAAPPASGSGGLTIRLDNPYLLPGNLPTIRSLLAPGATQFTLNRNNLDIGLRGEDTERKTSRIVLGLKGEPTENLSYEVSVNWGELKVNTNVLGNRYERNLRLAVDAARDAQGNIVCRSRLGAGNVVVATNDPVIDSCVPVNVLGPDMASPEASAYINADSTFEATVQQQVASGFVSYSLPFWELPGGQMGFALGAEYRKESSEAAYSQEVRDGLTFLNAIQPLDEDYSVKELFAEVRFPILADKFLAKELTINGSIRGAKYDLENTPDTIKAWNGGLQWAPHDDVRFRANLSSSVRTPTLADLYQPLTQNFATVRDPCDVQNVSQGSATRAANCASQGIPANFINTVARAQTIEIRSGGNDLLTEETSRSWTFGIVYEPHQFEGFSMSFDYFDIDVTKVIASVTAQQILDNCYDAASTNNIFCPLVYRNADFLFSTSANPQPGTNFGGGVLQSTLNYASRVARGVDGEFRYTGTIGDGKVNARLIGTYSIQRDNYPFLSEPNRPDQLLWELGDPQLAWNFDASYQQGPVTVSYGFRWLGSQYVDFIENVRSVGGRPPENADFSDIAFTGHISYHDVRLGYELNEGTDLYMGIDNIGDEMPPLGLTGTGAGSGIYSPRGRYWYAGVKWDL
jgi:outer membrane receptor protein involved in Fe transport